MCLDINLADGKCMLFFLDFPMIPIRHRFSVIRFPGSAYTVHDNLEIRAWGGCVLNDGC